MVSEREAMTKAELVEEVAGMTQLTKKHAEIIVNTVFESIVGSLRAGEKIELRGFGVFQVKPRKKGIGRNPRTGHEVKIPPGKTIRFKPGKNLRDLS